MTAFNSDESIDANEFVQRECMVVWLCDTKTVKTKTDKAFKTTMFKRSQF